MYSTGTTYKGADLLDKPPQNYETHKLREGDKAGMTVIDAEKGGIASTRVSTEDENKEPQSKWSIRRVLRKYKFVVHLFIWLLFTA